MALTLYRRHRLECEGGHAEDTRSGEFEEGRRGWKRCACAIHSSGTLGGKFNRRQTGKSDWTEAKAIAVEWERAGAWDSVPVGVPTLVEPTATASGGITIKDALEAFTAHRKNRGVTLATLKKYATFTKQLLDYAESRGYVRLEQFGVTDMDRFYASWNDGIRSKAK